MNMGALLHGRALIGGALGSVRIVLERVLEPVLRAMRIAEQVVRRRLVWRETHSGFEIGGGAREILWFGTEIVAARQHVRSWQLRRNGERAVEGRTRFGNAVERLQDPCVRKPGARALRM